MKRTLSAITTIVIAVGLAVTGVSTANADDAVPPVTSDVAPTPGPAATDVPAPTPSTPTPTPSTPTPTPTTPTPTVAPAPKTALVASAPAKSTTPNPSASPIPSNDTCLPSSAIRYSYDPTKNSGIVTVTAQPYSTEQLCAPLFITAASWKYTQAAVWPQVLDSSKTSYITVDKVGTYMFEAAVTCGQGDIYARTGSYIIPTSTLPGPQPWEKFLSGLGLQTTYPGNTYMQTPVGCAEIPTLPLTDPKPVTFVDTCGTEADKVVIPALTSDDHFIYSTSDVTSKGGVRTVTVTATPDKGYGFSSEAETSWSHTFKTDAQNNCVTVPGDPEAVGQTCAVSADGVVSGYLTVAPVTGVVYTIHPVTPAGADITVTAPKTNVAPGDYVITAAAEPGYILSGVTEWKRTVADNAVDCSLPTDAFLPSSVSWVGETCSAGGTVSGYIAIDPTDFLSYFVGTTQLVSARTAFAPGTYIVTVVAPAGDTIDGPSSYTATITKSATSCGNLDPQSLTTLAFTGFDSGAGYLAVASAFLMLGTALVFSARRKAKA
ncbi:hypothetical protein [Frigoribacterium sp. UYMn621]|uniref:hypothetical protein n=1 Tax=Frigoribacterium sp. UYMn621 TaxID=3156343 RepID=UPI0033929EDC